MEVELEPQHFPPGGASNRLPVDVAAALERQDYRGLCHVCEDAELEVLASRIEADDHEPAGGGPGPGASASSSSLPSSSSSANKNAGTPSSGAGIDTAEFGMCFFLSYLFHDGEIGLGPIRDGREQAVLGKARMLHMRLEEENTKGSDAVRSLLLMMRSILSARERDDYARYLELIKSVTVPPSLQPLRQIVLQRLEHRIGRAIDQHYPNGESDMATAELRQISAAGKAAAALLGKNSSASGGVEASSRASAAAGGGLFGGMPIAPTGAAAGPERPGAAAALSTTFEPLRAAIKFWQDNEAFIEEYKRLVDEAGEDALDGGGDPAGGVDANANSVGVDGATSPAIMSADDLASVELAAATELSNRLYTNRQVVRDSDDDGDSEDQELLDDEDDEMDLLVRDPA